MRFCLVLVALLAGCSALKQPDLGPQPSAAGEPAPVADSGGGGGTAGIPIGGMGGSAADSGDVTYHKDIRPLMEHYCLRCHVAGGAGPFPLDSWMTVQPAAPSVAAAAAGGIMPPKFWSDTCQMLRAPLSLSDAQKTLFKQWKDGGYPEGSELDYRPFGAPVPAPSLVMQLEQPYTPPANADESRCFVLDAIAAESYVTRVQILPLQAAEVDQVIVYRVAAAQRTQAQQLQDADAAPGYACSGGAMVPAQALFSYRSGADPLAFQAGDAAYIEAGSTLLLQVHFNTQFSDKDKLPAAEQTKLQLWTLPAGKLPDRVVFRATTTGPLAIAAGESHFVSMISSPMTQLFAGSMFLAGEVIGMTPHAHQLAKQMHASLKHADGTSTCLEDVAYDAHWQLDYLFDKGVPYLAGDTFSADCVYDNSASNQPVIAGKRQDPRAVMSGERSSDETCEHDLWLRADRTAFASAHASM